MLAEVAERLVKTADQVTRAIATPGSSAEEVAASVLEYLWWCFCFCSGFSLSLFPLLLPASSALLHFPHFHALLLLPAALPGLLRRQRWRRRWRCQRYLYLYKPSQPAF